LPAGLIDAELFGNVRNYPNPGAPERPGLIGSAHTGMLLLDEIGELSVELQSHLLRVLDARGEYQRLGESNTRRSDFLFIAATNREPDELRHDLLTRLALRIQVPELADRVEDIPLMVRHIVLEAARVSPTLAGRYLESLDDGQLGVRIEPELIEWMLRASYPGNMRELAALVWHAMSQSPDDVIVQPPDLGQPSAPSPATRNSEPSDDEITAALAASGGSVARAATLLQLSSRYALYRLITKRQLELPTRD
jgi:DNA-binding NtrC family response regulator